MTRILEGKLPNFNADVTPQPWARVSHLQKKQCKISCHFLSEKPDPFWAPEGGAELSP